MSAPYHHTPARGFTLVELLVAMTVIAILVAMITPAYMAVRRSAFEFAVTNDLEQLDAALDQFRTEYGFYPSDFSEFVAADGTPLAFTDLIPNSGGVTVEQRWLQFLAKIAPTHNENSPDPEHGPLETRLEHWWDEVGQLMVTDLTATGAAIKDNRLRGPQHALWFWLTQLYNDAQYPLTGQRFGPAGGDTNGNGVDDGIEIISEHQVFFDFSGETLEERVLAVPVNYPGGTFEYPIYRPIQRGGDSPLVYFHHDTFIENVAADPNTATVINFTPLAVSPEPLDIAKAVRVPGSVPAAGDFMNPQTYQIVTGGADEKFGEVDTGTYESFDNLCNFSEGRLEAFVTRFVNP